MRSEVSLVYFCAAVVTIVQILDPLAHALPSGKIQSTDFNSVLSLKRVKRVMHDPVPAAQYQYPQQQGYPQPQPGYPQQPQPHPGYPQPGTGYPQQPVFQQPTLTAAGALDGKACLHTLDCDAPNTVLTCEKGKCICPGKPHLSWTRGKRPLNTIWDINLKKCLGIKDAACDVFFPKSVYCQQGLSCHPDSHTGFGHCSTSPYKGSAQVLAAIGLNWTILLTFTARILY